MAKRYKTSTAGIVDMATVNEYWRTRLLSIALSSFSWHNLPPTISPRFLETRLLHDGNALFFNDEIIGYLVTRCTLGGNFDMQDIPKERRAYANNGYTNNLSDKDSVVIYDNLLHTSTLPYIDMFAKKLTNIEITKDINIRAQKTPVMVLCDEQQRLTLENLFMKIDCGAPVIFGTKNLDLENISTLDLKAPYVVDKLHDEQTKILHEAFSFLGIGSVEVEKKERLIEKEVQESNSGNIAQRSNRLKARQEAAEAINRMFGLDVWVEYNPEAEQQAQNLEGGAE